MRDTTLHGEERLADRLFSATIAQMSLEDEAHEAVMRAVGVDPDDVDSWPHEDFTHDYYDTSWEFKGVRPGWVPTAEQVAATFALGFSRCWICYTDGTEKHFVSPRPLHQESKPKPVSPYAADFGDEDLE